MIVNIPEVKEFQETGIEYLHLAYDGILHLVDSIREYDPDGVYLDEEERGDYWDKAKAKLKIYTGLAHQGVDFLLKAKIASVSPFLLLENNPDRYPGKKDKVEYSDFFSIESSKLVKVHDYVCSDSLSEDFKRKYELNRKRRNKIIHTVDNQVEIQGEEVMKEIISFSTYLTGSSWISERLKYLESKAEYNLYYESGVNQAEIFNEIQLFQEILKPAEYKKILGIPKSRRLYLCPECHQPDYNFENFGSAYLEPNKPTSTNIRCLVCESEFEVIREECSDSNCKSNVISSDSMTCRVCGEYK